MTEPSQPAPLELDTIRYELRLGERVLRLEKIPMELLILLAQKKGQLVGRQEIIDKLWGKDVFLDTEQGINTAIRKIRLALNDNPEHPRFLQTVVGKGYRFVGPITVTPNGSSYASEDTPRPDGQHQTRLAHGRQRPWPIALYSIALLAVLVVVLFVAKFPGVRRSRPTTKLAIRSIAVLPFENLSGDADQEYLADGIADALLTNLAQIHSLRVISRASTLQYRGTHRSLPQIARELNVDALVEGTLSRSGNRVRITAQLIEAATDQHLWADVYERNVEDLLRLQSEIALNVTTRISATLSSEEQLRLASFRQTQPEAQEAYLRGRYLLSLRGQDNLVRAPYYFQLAVDKDPAFAEAYAGLAESYSTLAGWGLIKGADADAKILPAALKAVQLDDNSSAAHTALASFKCTQRDREGVEGEIRRALQLNPSNSTAHKLYGLYLHLTGDFDGAIAEETRAQELDPFSAHLRLSLGHVLYDAKQFDRAIVQFQKAIELEPEFHFLYLNIGWSYAHQGLHEAAVKEWSRHWVHTPAVAGVLNRAYEKWGYRSYLRAELGQEFAKAIRPMIYPTNYQRAVIYAELGEKDHAFSSLAKAVQQHDEDLEELLVDPDLESLRSDPRFDALVQRCRRECGASRPF